MYQIVQSEQNWTQKVENDGTILRRASSMHVG